MYNKGIILEIKSKYSIVMTQDSNIVKIKNKKDMKVGSSILFLDEDIYQNNIINFSFSKALYPLIAAIFLFIFILPIFKNNTTAYSLVSFDLNPSIQIELNKNKKIINIYGINDDGKSIPLEELKGLSLNDGALKLKEILESQGYVLSNDRVLIGFTFFKNINDPTYEEDIKNIISKNFNNTNLLYLKGNNSDILKAKNKGVSLGRYEANLELDDDIIEDKIENMSVDEIFDLLDGKAGIYLNEEIIDELEDKLDDNLEDYFDDDDNDDNNDDDDTEDDTYDDDDDNHDDYDDDFED